MIYKATKEDSLTIAGLAVLMWDNHTVEELAEANRVICFTKKL